MLVSTSPLIFTPTKTKNIMLTTTQNMPEVAEVTDSTIILETEVELDRAEYEKWADIKDKREYASDSSDHTGSHVQFCGRMPWDEYYASKYFAEDMKEYLCLMARTVPAILSTERNLGASFNHFKASL